MQYETKQGIEDYEEQKEDSSDSENEDGTDVTSASYDEVCILSKTCAACLWTTIKFTLYFDGQDQDNFDESADEYDDYDDDEDGEVDR